MFVGVVATATTSCDVAIEKHMIHVRMFCTNRTICLATYKSDEFFTYKIFKHKPMFMSTINGLSTRRNTIRSSSSSSSESNIQDAYYYAQMLFNFPYSSKLTIHTCIVMPRCCFQISLANKRGSAVKIHT
jgi:hypothetical protein